MVNMLSDFVLKNRKLFILLILSYTIFMAYMGQFVKFNYDFSQTVPDTDEDMIYYNSFKNTFGEDGNVFAVGLKDSSIFSLEKFMTYRNYINDLESIEGVWTKTYANEGPTVCVTMFYKDKNDFYYQIHIDSCFVIGKITGKQKKISEHKYEEENAVYFFNGEVNWDLLVLKLLKI